MLLASLITVEVIVKILSQFHPEVCFKPVTNHFNGLFFHTVKVNEGCHAIKPNIFVCVLFLGEQIHSAAPLRLFASLTCYKPFIQQVAAVALYFVRHVCSRHYFPSSVGMLGWNINVRITTTYNDIYGSLFNDMN